MRGYVSIAVGLCILQGFMMLARLNLPSLPSLADPSSASSSALRTATGTTPTIQGRLGWAMS